jgi:lactoylglutathione lyase
MIKIEHIAIWANDIETMKNFYKNYFNAVVGTKYHNPSKQFQSYFLSFPTGARLEIMQRPDIKPVNADKQNQEFMGFAHLAFSFGSKHAVDSVSRRLISDGYENLSGPRYTGDGYYESIFLDPENNRIELTL